MISLVSIVLNMTVFINPLKRGYAMGKRLVESCFYFFIAEIRQEKSTKNEKCSVLFNRR